MDRLDEFLDRLLSEGRIVFRGPPGPADHGDGRAAAVLGRAFDAYRLDVAGPPIDFDPAVAVEAGELVRQASWALVSRGDRAEDLAPRLRMSRRPASPSHHLSADLALRFLPQLHRRARSFDPADPIVPMLAAVLRRWPLSGVLSGVDEGPEEPPDFSGHPGLMLLYAERLARAERPAWRPAGAGAEFVELVLRGLGRDRSPLLATAAGGEGDG
jgi:hypothetical protein